MTVGGRQFRLGNGRPVVSLSLEDLRCCSVRSEVRLVNRS